jgi:hypothetical protein
MPRMRNTSTISRFGCSAKEGEKKERRDKKIQDRNKNITSKKERDKR